MRTREFSEAIRWRVDDPIARCTVIEYQPGNGSRYVVMFSKVPVAACEGIGCLREAWAVSLVDGAQKGKCAVFSASGHLLPSNVAKKLRIEALASKDDLLVLTEIIGHVLGRKTPSALDPEGYVERIQEE